jgi:hypothetical protein
LDVVVCINRIIDARRFRSSYSAEIHDNTRRTLECREIVRLSDPVREVELKIKTLKGLNQ